jgi:hypothetical protein
MAETAELVEYVEILEAVLVAKVVEVAKVVGTTVMFDKVKGTGAAPAETELAELEPVTITGTRAPVEMAK